MSLPISVIIPCYKQERWLDKAIESAIDQSNDVVVIHDGNPDLMRQARHYEAASIYRSETFFRNGIRAGVCYSRNIGIECARNDLIVCLDADDRLYPGALQELYNTWKPNTWVYGGLYTEIEEDETPRAGMKTPPPGMLRQKNLTYSTFLFHRDDWAKAGGFDPDFEPLEEDYAFQCALTHHGVKPVRDEYLLLYKRMIHANSRTSQAMKYWHITQELCRQKWPSVFQ